MANISKSVVSMNIIHNEVHLFGFHVHAAAHKSLITKSNCSAQLMWCKAHRQWSLDHWKLILWSDKSRFTCYHSDDRVWRKFPARMHCALSKVWQRGNYDLIVFLSRAQI
ncbi:transposable element Tc1 transposase [Caerostris extrusa]|uniref:Transposable element Tc1 transposase n=1 Tax=Caerostris extrusa TaxID=172846 RepID=A0AAV4XU43_CAEEX|nr:transposable element Tc1 transposase [Caerostris extrusa]